MTFYNVTASLYKNAVNFAATAAAIVGTGADAKKKSEKSLTILKC